MHDWPVDSPEGIRMLLAWAKAGGYVLNGAHLAIARKHGADTTGVTFTQPLPPLPRLRPGA